MKVYNHITELIGNTPILRHPENHNVFMKIEGSNPLGSVKDRVAFAIIDDIEKNNRIKKGGTIVEATSGNTGIGLAYVCASKGYKLILTMPESMSDERKNLLKALGATLILTPKELGMQGAVKKAEELAKSTDNAILARQFENACNPKIHYETTAKEIYSDMDGKIDALVCGIGTGGTFSGCAKFLKEKNSKIFAVAVEPYDSPLLSSKKAGAHKIQGIGANFVPKNLQQNLIDRVMTAKYEDAQNCVYSLSKHFGIFIGISSGAALSCALELSKEQQFVNKNIVVVLPDGGEKYISTGIFTKEDN